jgi:hypothetical protein
MVHQAEVIQTLLAEEIATVAGTLGIKKGILELWAAQFKPDLTLITLMHMSKKHLLDPLANEITIVQYLNSTNHVFIPIHGWMKIINQHTQFSGMSLQQATEEKEGIPVWMECCIYRKDRILPIVIKEYFDEVKSEHPGWKELPRRMLRHRAIQQCARLAFNIGLLHIDQSESSGAKNQSTDNKTKVILSECRRGVNQIQKLKQILVNPE